MNSYSTQKALSSYTIDKTLLENIEDYLTRDILSIVSINQSNQINNSDIPIKNSPTITIYDFYGEEKFITIRDYRHTFFHDDIKAIEVDFNYKDKSENKELKINLRFGKKDNSNMSIFLINENPKEKVIAIQQGLLSIMAYNKNSNWLNYPPELLKILFIFVGVISGVIIQNRTGEKQPLFWIPYLTIIVYVIIANSLKGYCSFESKKQKQIDKWFNWFIAGLLSFVIFSSILTILRNNLFGF